MPKATANAKIRPGPIARNASGIINIVQDQDVPSNENKEHESRGKRTKGKGRAKKKVVTRRESVDTVKPPLHREWADIPDWKGKKESPLMNLPVELLDQIFCVRPELEPADYLALAGTCTFFRDRMTDDFWEDIASQQDDMLVMAFAGVPTPKSQPIAGAHPFSRQIEDWKTPHCETILDDIRYPKVSTRRTVSKWSSDAQGGVIENNGYRSGHYVPLGPRSSWTKAQYMVYKEEQSRWRQNRDEHRREGMRQLLWDYHRDLVNNETFRTYTSEIRLVDETGLIGIRRVVSRTLGIDYTISDEETGSSARQDETSETNHRIKLTRRALRRLAHELETRPIPKNDSYKREAYPCIHRDLRILRDKSWIAPESEPSETEDEFQWLWDRGAKLVHDHWPSAWRGRLAGLVNVTCITKEFAMKQYRLDEWELSTLKSLEVRNAHEEITDVYLKRAVEARAMKFHGGRESHERYVSALFEQEETVKRKKEEKFQREMKKLRTWLS